MIVLTLQHHGSRKDLKIDCQDGERRERQSSYLRAELVVRGGRWSCEPNDHITARCGQNKDASGHKRDAQSGISTVICQHLSQTWSQSILERKSNWLSPAKSLQCYSIFDVLQVQGNASRRHRSADCTESDARWSSGRDGGNSCDIPHGHGENATNRSAFNQKEIQRNHSCICPHSQGGRIAGFLQRNVHFIAWQVDSWTWNSVSIPIFNLNVFKTSVNWSSTFKFSSKFKSDSQFKWHSRTVGSYFL